MPHSLTEVWRYQGPLQIERDYLNVVHAIHILVQRLTVFNNIGPNERWLAVGDGGSVEADAVASRQNGIQRQPNNLK